MFAEGKSGRGIDRRFKNKHALNVSHTAQGTFCSAALSSHAPAIVNQTIADSKQKKAPLLQAAPNVKRPSHSDKIITFPLVLSPLIVCNNQTSLPARLTFDRRR